jgi:hypothetical protein
VGYISTKKCASIVGGNCYAFELTRCINCKWLFLTCAIIAFSERYDIEPNNTYVCELVLEEADCSMFFGVTVMWACTSELYVF